jgi:hypothetical protein
MAQQPVDRYPSRGQQHHTTKWERKTYRNVGKGP